jgi:integrase
MKLSDFFNTTYRPLRLRGRSPKTTLLYVNLFRQFDRWLAAEGIATEGCIEHLDELILARYLDHRASCRSAYTAEKERSQLLALARLAWERRVPGLERMPTCPPGVLPQRVPTSWTTEEMQRVFEVASHAQRPIHGVPANEFFTALLMLCWETGERIGAVLAIPASEYRRPSVMVQPETRKGGKEGRIYSLSPDLCDRLDRLAVHKHERLIPWTGHFTALYGRLKVLLTRAGLGGRRLAFHQIRRTAISHIAAAGGDPVAFAGHSNPSVTRRWYIDPRLSERGPKPHELLPRLDPPHEPPAAA